MRNNSSFRLFPLFTLLFLLSFITSSTAQVHFKTGYSISYFKPEQNNKLLRAFNKRNNWLKTPFDDVNWLHGMNLGIKYRLGFVGIEAGWTANFTKTNAEGTDPVTNLDFSKRLIYRYNTFSVGVENFIKQFGFGATLNYNRLNVISKVEGDGRNELLHTNQYSGTLFIGIYTEHYNGISFGLRPFLQLPLSQLNISGLDSDLGELSGTTTKEKSFWLFGVSLLIFNGY